MNVKKVLGLAVLASGLVGVPVADVLAAAPTVLDDQMISTVCVQKRSGAVRIIDQQKKNTCRKTEATYRDALKVYDANKQFLGFAGLGSNDPYSVSVYVPSLKQYISLQRKPDGSGGSPNNASLTTGDISDTCGYTQQPQYSINDASVVTGYKYVLGCNYYRTTYYSEANCGGQVYIVYNTHKYVYKSPENGKYYQQPTLLSAVTVKSSKNEYWDIDTSTNVGKWTADDCSNITDTTSQLKALPTAAPTEVTLPFTTPVALPLSYE